MNEWMPFEWLPYVLYYITLCRINTYSFLVISQLYSCTYRHTLMIFTTIFDRPAKLVGNMRRLLWWWNSGKDPQWNTPMHHFSVPYITIIMWQYTKDVNGWKYYNSLQNALHSWTYLYIPCRHVYVRMLNKYIYHNKNSIYEITFVNRYSHIAISDKFESSGDGEITGGTEPNGPPVTFGCVLDIIIHLLW